MSDAMWIEGKEYISSKRASELSGYAQDYIGQLARKGIIDAQRVGGLWFISMTSLTEYKSHADSYIPQQPERKEVPDNDSLVAFDGKDHVSASRAAKITGYHPDYVGQLARSGAIISRQVGNRWYIDREGILSHKQEKDSLLGAVQAQSVGIARGDAPAEHASEGIYNGSGPFLTYTRDDGDLLPVLEKPQAFSPAQEIQINHMAERESNQEYAVPIRTIRTQPSYSYAPQKTLTKRPAGKMRTSGKTIYHGTFRNLAAAALTIVIVLSFGFVTLKDSSVYGTNTSPTGGVIHKNMFTASAAQTLERIEHFMQEMLVKELVYRRAE